MSLLLALHGKKCDGLVGDSPAPCQVQTLYVDTVKGKNCQSLHADPVTVGQTDRSDILTINSQHLERAVGYKGTVGDVQSLQLLILFQDRNQYRISKPVLGVPQHQIMETCVVFCHYGQCPSRHFVCNATCVHSPTDAEIKRDHLQALLGDSPHLEFGLKRKARHDVLENHIFPRNIQKCQLLFLILLPDISSNKKFRSYLKTCQIN